MCVLQEEKQAKIDEMCKKAFEEIDVNGDDTSTAASCGLEILTSAVMIALATRAMLRIGDCHGPW